MEYHKFSNGSQSIMWHGHPSPVEKRSQGRLRSTILKVRSDSGPIEKHAAEKVRPRALRGVFKNFHYLVGQVVETTFTFVTVKVAGAPDEAAAPPELPCSVPQTWS